MQLTDIDARALRDDVLERVSDHLADLVIAVAPASDWRLPSTDEMTTLRYAAEMLVHYAQGGIPAVQKAGGDWRHHGNAGDAFVEVCHALYSCAAGEQVDPLAVADDADPADELGLVIIAAGARVRLDQGGALAPRELGALAGLTAERVRQLIQAGEIVTDGAGRRYAVPAEEAKRWLTSRRVPGVE